MTEKVLFVDDDPNIISAIKRQFRNDFKISVASSGQEGLNMIHQQGPFSVVVADMQMPEMNGIEFLKRVQKLAPDTVRLMLTGNADQRTAIDAVNKGNVFRFMTKPCSHELLVNSIEAAQSQYQLIHAEQELLEGTLNGSVKLLLDVLSLAAPGVSDRAITLRETVIELARTMHIANTWEMEMAAMLAQIAYITLPPESLSKTLSGEPLSQVEQQVVDHLPETGYKLLANIPRLNKVANIVLYQEKNFDGSGVPHDGFAGEDIPMESRILKVLYDFKALEENKGLSVEQALEQMQECSSHYDPQVLQKVAWFLANREKLSSMSPPTEVTVRTLLPGQILVSNVETEDGQLLFSTGHVLSSATVEKLVNHHQIHKIKEPIQVSIPLK